VQAGTGDKPYLEVTDGHFLQLLHHSHDGDAKDDGQAGMLLRFALQLLGGDLEGLRDARELCKVPGGPPDPLIRAVHEVHLWLANYAGFPAIYVGEGAADACTPEASAEQLKTLMNLLDALDNKLILNVTLIDNAVLSGPHQDRIFAQLNCRGKDMTVADKFKARMYHLLEEKHTDPRATVASRRKTRSSRAKEVRFKWTRSMSSEDTLQVCAYVYALLHCRLPPCLSVRGIV
jgi:hypothetical protein